MVQIDGGEGRRTIRLDDWVAIIGLLVAVAVPSLGALSAAAHYSGVIVTKIEGLAEAQRIAAAAQDRQNDKFDARIEKLEQRQFEMRSHP